METKNIPLKNTITVEWPDYLIRCPYTALRDDRNNISLRQNRDLSKEQPKTKLVKTINTNFKYGLSKDTPFETKYTEFHSLTKGILNRDKELTEERKQVFNWNAKI